MNSITLDILALLLTIIAVVITYGICFSMIALWRFAKGLRKAQKEHEENRKWLKDWIRQNQRKW